MSATVEKPDVAIRIKRYVRDIALLSQDVRDMELNVDKLNRWQSDDCITKASFLFDRILQLDFDYRSIIYRQPDLYEDAVDDQIQELARQWYEITCELLSKLPGSFADDDELEKLKSQNRQMKNMLTPDDEFFVGPALDKLCEQALEDHQLGKTAPLVFDELD